MSLLMKRILRDPHGKDRDLRSAWCAGEISRNNSEPRLAWFPRSARAEKDVRNQGEFLRRRTDVPTRLSFRDYGSGQ